MRKLSAAEAPVIKVDRWNPSPEVMSRAASILKSGGLVAFPTETVYGLGADGLNPSAVKKIFEAKGRPSDNPLILHLTEAARAEELAELDERARSVMAAFWPGPLTIVLRARANVSEEVRAGLPTVALRVPSHPVALALIEAAGCPVAAPSANRSGRPSPTDAAAVAEDLGGGVALVLDSGMADIGVESTVVDLSGRAAALLRPGGVPAESLEEFLGEPLDTPDEDSKKRSPGTRHKHYAPSVPVRIWTPGTELDEPVEPDAWGFMGVSAPPVKFARVISFESQENYARGVFAGFRQLESEGLGIVAEWPEAGGIGLALRDRIKRASAS